MNATVQSRIDFIFKLYLNGITSTRAINKIVNDPENENCWSVSGRQLRYYCQLAKNLLKEHSKTVREEQFGLSLGRLEYLYQQSVKLTDYKTALQVQKEINELLGLKFQNELIERLELLERNKS